MSLLKFQQLEIIQVRNETKRNARKCKERKEKKKSRNNYKCIDDVYI